MASTRCLLYMRVRVQKCFKCLYNNNNNNNHHDQQHVYYKGAFDAACNVLFMLTTTKAIKSKSTLPTSNYFNTPSQQRRALIIII